MPSTENKVPWLPLIIAVLVVPLLLAALATLTGMGERDPIERDLKSRSQQALATAGISGAAVEFEGRDATISGVPAGQEDAAQKAVDEVDGVRVADVGGSGGGSGEGESAVTVDATADDITLTGEVPDNATKAELLAAAEEKAEGRTVVDKLTVAEGAAPSVDAKGVGALVEATAGSGSDVSAEASGDTITLTGAVASEEEKTAAAEKAATANPDAEVDNQITVDAEKAALQKKIDALIKAQGITFASNKADLTAKGAQTVRRVAAALKSAPGVKIRVDGHFAGKFGTEAHQLRLTEERAEVVRKRLVQSGVDAGQISTKGFGATKPIADESTPEGQAANRRVEIKVL